MSVNTNISPAVAIDDNGHAVSYVTMDKTVLVKDNKTLNNFIDETFKEGNDLPALQFKNNLNNCIVLMMDDVTTLHYRNYKTLLKDRGFSATMGLRQDYITGDFTWAKLLEMQQNGIDVAYHGYSHAFGGTEANMNTDLTSFNEGIKGKNINIYGCMTPNGYAAPSTWKDKFLYIRTGGLNGVDNVSNLTLQDGFGQISTCFLDDLTSDTALETLKTSISTLFTDVNNKTLTLSIHLSTTNMPYLDSFLAWCYENSIPVISAKKACENYVIKYGGMDSKANIFNILAGTETNNYFIVAGNGKVRTNQFTTI